MTAVLFRADDPPEPPAWLPLLLWLGAVGQLLAPLAGFPEPRRVAFSPVVAGCRWPGAGVVGQVLLGWALLASLGDDGA